MAIYVLITWCGKGKAQKILIGGESLTELLKCALILTSGNSGLEPIQKGNMTSKSSALLSLPLPFLPPSPFHLPTF